MIFTNRLEKTAWLIPTPFFVRLCAEILAAAVHPQRPRGIADQEMGFIGADLGQHIGIRYRGKKRIIIGLCGKMDFGDHVEIRLDLRGIDPAFRTVDIVALVMGEHGQ